MKIVVVQSGPDHEVFPLMSLLIGLEKKYGSSKATWIGNPRLFDLVRFNKRVGRCIPLGDTSSLGGLKSFFGADLLINSGKDKIAMNVASISGAKKVAGFTNSGAVDRNAEFFDKVMYGGLKTNRHVLDLYYSLADLKWQGEGYGLSYYPRTKQNKNTGVYLSDDQSMRMPDKLLGKMDSINEFAEVVTDDLFVCHAAIALRKKVTLEKIDLCYRICFFGKGLQKRSSPETEPPTDE